MHHFRFSQALKIFPEAGHLVALLTPDEPNVSPDDETFNANQVARDEYFPQLLAFIRSMIANNS